jgi:O-antigen ligase
MERGRLFRAGAAGVSPNGDAASASGDRGSLTYTLAAAVITMFLYPVGHATVGFILLFLGLLWRLMRRRAPLWHRTSLDLPLAVFAALLALSAALSPYRVVATAVTLMLLASGLTLFGSFTWLLHRAAPARMLLLRVFALGSPVAAAIGLLSLRYQDRASTPRGVGPNGLALTLLLGGILCLGLAFRSRGRARGFWLGSTALTLAGLFATQTRAAWIGWTLGALYLTLQELRHRPKRLAVILACVLIAAALVGAGIMRERLYGAREAKTPPAPVDMAAPADDEARIMGWQIPRVPPPAWIAVRDSLQKDWRDRTGLWRASAEMAWTHPWLGTGFGTYFDAYNRWKDPKAAPKPFAHDLPLNVLAEDGMLGLAAACWIAGAGIAAWVRQPNSGGVADPARAIVPALWIGLLVNQLADNSMNAVNTSAGFWLLLALLVSAPLPAREHEDGLPSWATAWDGRRGLKCARREKSRAAGRASRS